MNGRSVLWVPGLDHAGIATQVVVERHLAANGLGTRHSLGRDGFLKESWKWRESKGDLILQQLRHLGCSLDWSKEYFTLDEVRSYFLIIAIFLYYESCLSGAKSSCRGGIRAAT
jgi:valyl-tRNA synthetase